MSFWDTGYQRVLAGLPAGTTFHWEDVKDWRGVFAVVITIETPGRACTRKAIRFDDLRQSELERWLDAQIAWLRDRHYFTLVHARAGYA